ncbi:MAG: Coenzyme F420 hydrogenase/dehydrogenase, beta subunit C-terminal domain [Bacteroidales bacterium]|nr:Coenzyme F420 hydrogenase/dehydrogenase, beta subunit C-terminal domain [Bacteroidales bacterium]
MIDIVDKNRCCGCSACMAVCPHDAIYMRKDALGFPYPAVRTEDCTDCGLCKNVCDYVKEHDSHHGSDISELNVWAARNIDADVLASSQSGGVFSALSDVVLSRNGVVYGAVIGEDFSVAHIRAEDRRTRDMMRGSKYVQSDMGNVFRQVRKDLSEGKEVLFSGTPCQTAGLASYVPEKFRTRLFLVDFICHGVSSPYVWRDYVSYMERKGPLSQVCFRDKGIEGWKVHKESFIYEDGRTASRETFRVLFYKNIMLRRNCSSCPYHIGNRKADITIADFWGIEEIMPEMDGNDGTSMVIFHTPKGLEMKEDAAFLMDMKSLMISRDFMSRRNPNLVRPARPYKDRDLFEKEFAEKGFLHVARKWGDMGWRYKAWQMKVFFRKITGKK